LLKTTRTAALTVFALDQLAGQESCCPKCCTACWVLYDMKINDDLDTTIRKAPPRMYESGEWWDHRTDSVRKVWLTEKWSYECPNHEEDDED
jgi:hypothetical protein